jgi:hypothetical protein
MNNDRAIDDIHNSFWIMRVADYEGEIGLSRGSVEETESEENRRS